MHKVLSLLGVLCFIFRMSRLEIIGKKKEPTDCTLGGGLYKEKTKKFCFGIFVLEMEYKENIFLSKN